MSQSPRYSFAEVLRRSHEAAMRTGGFRDEAYSPEEVLGEALAILDDASRFAGEAGSPTRALMVAALASRLRDRERAAFRVGTLTDYADGIVGWLGRRVPEGDFQVWSALVRDAMETRPDGVAGELREVVERERDRGQRRSEEILRASIGEVDRALSLEELSDELWLTVADRGPNPTPMDVWEAFRSAVLAPLSTPPGWGLETDDLILEWGPTSSLLVGTELFAVWFARRVGMRADDGELRLEQVACVPMWRFDPGVAAYGEGDLWESDAGREAWFAAVGQSDVFDVLTNREAYVGATVRLDPIG